MIHCFIINLSHFGQNIFWLKIIKYMCTDSCFFYNIHLTQATKFFLYTGAAVATTDTARRLRPQPFDNFVTFNYRCNSVLLWIATSSAVEACVSFRACYVTLIIIIWSVGGEVSTAESLIWARSISCTWQLVDFTLLSSPADRSGNACCPGPEAHHSRNCGHSRRWFSPLQNGQYPALHLRGASSAETPFSYWCCLQTEASCSFWFLWVARLRQAKRDRWAGAPFGFLFYGLMIFRVPEDSKWLH